MLCFPNGPYCSQVSLFLFLGSLFVEIESSSAFLEREPEEKKLFCLSSVGKLTMSRSPWGLT